MDFISRLFPQYVTNIKSRIRSQAKQRYQDATYSKLVPKHMHMLACLQRVIDVPGALAETGVRGGGTLSIIAGIASIIMPDRHIFGFDSFEGFPADAEVAGKTVTKKPRDMTPEELMDVVRKRVAMAQGQAQPRNLTLVQGYFNDSLPGFDTGPIAFLHIDVDIGKSYTEVLTHLYPKVAPGGIICFDEYDAPIELERWPDAKPAIDDYLRDKEYKDIPYTHAQKKIIQKIK